MASATGSPDAREFYIKPLLHIVEDVFNRVNPHITSMVLKQAAHDAQNALDVMTHQYSFSEIINKIACEMSCKCSGRGDPNAATSAILEIVSSYPSDAKVVLALAAFAVNYGEFWFVRQLCYTNPLAKSVAFLKQCPDILKRPEVLQPKFDAINNHIKEMLKVTNTIGEIEMLASQYLDSYVPDTTDAVNWIIRSTVVCASQISGLIVKGHGDTASWEAWESDLAQDVGNINSRLEKQRTDIKAKIQAACQRVKHIWESDHEDNMKILRELIKGDQHSLFDGFTKKLTSLDVLMTKHVLLFISDLDVSYEEFSMLQKMYAENRGNTTRVESQYEIVWIPVVDTSTPWDARKQKNFKSLQLEMPWYSVSDHSLVGLLTIKYIKEFWNFKKKPLLVALDPQGKVVNPNAIHMTRIWGNYAFPFNITKEEALWKGETWRIELLADRIEPNIKSWIKDGKYICLYGGEDIEWIRTFTIAAKDVAKEAHIQLEILYVGKNNPKDKVQSNNNIISNENLSHVLPDVTLIWSFWVRLESMWHSIVQLKRNKQTDIIMHEIMSTLSFDGSEQGWAMIIKGSSEIAKAKGHTILNSFRQFESWKKQAEAKGFVPALNDKLHELHAQHHCNRLILPWTTASLPERVVCDECGRTMEKFIMYRCCTD